METPSFLRQSAPPGYVAGVGRGAVGFSTRGNKDDKRIPARLNGQARDTVHTSSTKSPNRYSSEVTTNLAEQQRISLEEEEEKKVYEGIGQRLKNRKGPNNSASSSSNTDEESSKLPSKFVDLKRNLATLSDQDWLNIPDASDMTRRNKRSRIDEQLERKTFSAPDTLFQPNVNLSKLTEEREKLLAVQIDKNFDSNKNQPTDDAEYLNRMALDDNSLFSADYEEIRKNRSILAGYRKSHPRNADNWISSARIEERAKQFTRAKKLISEGCKLCPKHEAIWLESLRLHDADREYCKRIVTIALRLNSSSEKLWLKAVDLEQNASDKVKVTRKALLQMPLNSTFWRIAADLEHSVTEKIKILTKAVELAPNSSQLWLELIRLQPFESAKETLASTENYIKNDIKYWILKCEVEEKSDTNDEGTLSSIISEGIQHLQSQNGTPTLYEWFEEAVSVSSKGLYPQTAKAIITAAVSKLYDDSKFSDFKTLYSRLVNDTVLQSSLFSSVLIKYPTKYSVWKEFSTFAKRFSKESDLNHTFERIIFLSTGAVKAYPILVLMYAKNLWNWGSGSSEALKIIDRALTENPAYLGFWLAKLKILNRNNSVHEISQCFNESQEHLGEQCVQIVLFYVKCLQYHSSLKLALSVIDTALKRHKKTIKLHILKADVYQQLKDISSAKLVLSGATELFGEHPELCIAAAKLEIKTENWGKARSILSVALLKNPKSDILYEALIDMEWLVKDEKQVVYLVSQGLKCCSNSWRLWCQNIKTLRKKSMRKTTFQEALEATKEHPMVLTEIGKTFLNEFQFTKAHKWFTRATENNLKFGDPWVWLYICESRINSSDLQDRTQKILAQLNEEEPRYGKLWEPALESYLHASDPPTEILHAVVKKLQI
ncbi:unnamed protein product [Kluyveromyces dobzhanskii CBS 2104]|uniref:WGS project CCBQ000000000 data, contig 00015 n=1 Tax=Kluyveromyces dobzhanskii CBS 2104 TaxID=1427455 RepID=A0A0A8LBG8_9SACH|nr:unnamed protein product [Kluyveromyces dobzhanskii CBS 2104]